MKIYTREELIAEFWRYYKEFGKYPTGEELFANPGYPSMYPYNRIFGTWNNFLKEINVIGKYGWYKHDEDVLYQMYYDQPKEKIISSLVTTKKWETIKQKASEMGLRRSKDISSPKKYTKEFLISEFWRFFKENGRYPLGKDFKKKGNEYPSQRAYESNWGTWTNFLKDIDVLGEDGWYKYDEQILIDNYEHGNKDEVINQLMIKRTWNVISSKARKLGVYRSNRDQIKDIKGIIEDYKNGMSPAVITTKYKFQSQASIFDILRKNNVELKLKRWTKEEVRILKEMYPLGDWKDIQLKLPGRDKNSIKIKANELKLIKINRPNDMIWSEAEEEILNKHYGKLSMSELTTLLNNRTYSSITSKARKLGLRTREYWSEEELDILQNNFSHMTTLDLAELIDRSVDCIQVKANNLGLKKDFETYKEHNGNGNPFYNIYYTSNGEECYSKPELLISELLIDNQIQYEKEVYYRDIVNDERTGLKRSDWFLEDGTVIEYFGLVGKSRKYDASIRVKQEICNDNDIKLIEIYPEDINYKLKGVKKKIKKYLLSNNEAV